MTKDTTFRQELEKAQAELSGKTKIGGRRSASAGNNKKKRPHRLQKVLVANRGEIAKRFFLALHEESIPSVAVVTDADRGQSWYEFADEVVFIGDKYNYTNIPLIIAACELTGANAIYAGYGFLSENAFFVKRIAEASEIYGREIIYMGPDARTMEVMGDKVSSRNLARENDVPLFESTDVFHDPDIDRAKREAERIGYPVIIKLSAGGGGKGMYPVFDESELPAAIGSTCRIGEELYGDKRFYMERFIQRPVHIEVQVFNGKAIGIRKCAVQRRNQKIIEESGHTFLEDHMSLAFLAAAERLAIVSGYANGCGAGTVEFLVDAQTGAFGFMEMNTRLQVEYAVTDQSLGIDLVKWQVLNYDGRENDIKDMAVLKYKVADRQHAIECRIYAEESENDYLPSPGTIVEMDFPTFNGIRSDFGFREGDSILPFYDPMIGKLIAHGPTRQEALIRLERGLQELYIRGVKTNINQLLRIVRHPEFVDGNYTNNILEDNPSLSFKESDEELRGAVDKRVNKHVVFGAFSEYIKMKHQVVNDFIVIARLKGLLDCPPSQAYPYRFRVEYNGTSFMVEFLQTSINNFHVFVNGVYCDQIVLTSFNDRSDDFLLMYANGSTRARVERHTGYLVLRMRDASGKINYFRMSVSPEGIEGTDTRGDVLSPFQGSFVSFPNDSIKVGKHVHEGEPLVILSAMKMETTLTASISGTISYIVEEGDLSRLQISKTLDGRIIGKSLQEGELIIKITPDEEKDSQSDKSDEMNDQEIFPVSDHTLDILYRDNCEDLIISEPQKHVCMLVELFKANVQGFIPQKSIIEKLRKVMDMLPVESWDFEEITDMFLEIINYYTGIKQLFSPESIHDGVSLLDELDRYIIDPRHDLDGFTPEFRRLIDSIQSSYGLDNLNARPAVLKFFREQLIHLVRLSYQFNINHPDIIRNHIQIVSGLRMKQDTFKALKKLYDQEQSELYDSPARYIKKLLTENFHDMSFISEDKAHEEAEKIICSITEEKKSFYRSSLAKPEKGLIPSGVDKDFSKRLSYKLDILQKTYNVERIVSEENVHFYRMTGKKDGKQSYAVFISIHAETSEELAGYIGSVLLSAGCLIVTYQQIEKLSGNWIDLYISGCSLEWKHSDDPGTLDYRLLRNRALKIRKFFYEEDVEWGYVDIAVKYPAVNSYVRRILMVRRKEDDLTFDIAHPTNHNHPYWSEEDKNSRSQKLFNMDKWPITLWADVCFDPDSAKELRIPSIDDNGERQVGAHIYIGEINGSGACFYLKDSRISGGATGDYEGRKYVAACYYAYMKGLPLYVFNDSAGANIKEGVVSLNRGGEGFMMNTLLSENVEVERFLKYTKNSQSPVLRKLFKEMDDLFSLSEDEAKSYNRTMGLVAVGIGASAGLDVYGSSQATVQVILDSENSYRVLTGSNVIRSVMGEYISNYDIGGAKILGKWTGIVDLVARDKVNLITLVHELQNLFCVEKQEKCIARIQYKSDKKSDHAIQPVLDEQMIRMNVDGGYLFHFKRDYYGSNALISAFVKLAGRKLLVLGARTHSGIRSSKAVRKARELLKIADRTRTPQIFVFGKYWLQTPANHENMYMRSRLDYMETLRDCRSRRYHIITDAQGLRCYDTNAYADALIFVKNEKIDPSDLTFAEKNATFVVSSLEEAFDLCARLVAYTEPVENSKPETAPEAGGIPDIPSDNTVPFEVIESVINPVFDRDSFIEYFREMNVPAGPNLVTGLAKLNGETVGVIADQPQIKGGAADAQGTEKFRVFVRFLNKNNIPLIMLSNSSGFVPGSQQERFRIQAIGAESLDTNILGQVPVVSVVLNQNYGGRMIQAFNKFLRPGIVYIALKQAIIAVMGADPAFDLFHGKEYHELIESGREEEARKIKDDFYSLYLGKAKADNDALKTELIDEIVPEVKELRDYLIRGLVEAKKRCIESF